ncbi:hypothetical protein HBI56_156470 [Parastagonospora nodorum]|uniref:Uncharacterized protein n=2 Tax=Phaeosphaeria nodorum (strain SN15 / ATCC MYA-4574 / FGSC 10173) TaxID=321614 RepID=A0A7U2I8T3_PHANO|nr:hypothetical protein SNOG_11247 [Parastagonospora nodorum SN15]KAH3912775.1 hypothetical protein HBH56_119160 [Parastagonospora nodorum]EAT81746.1 hypothetical protein SNOG_11247 [Parastagonospora nodorum SN15]KAH3928717.1 hypothetical protein HBH54_130040 [Parastagonospora nodorum]KAH3950549.1 hypothetical protein HBH53_070330 [Parastagonospora nodorum]KAH3959826.1 hypothetical protein HBH51_197550 [Parastagonospora nodorum]
MHDEHPHPLLAQVPLTISPFLSLPTATPLPYSYKTLPSTLPPSVLQNPDYVTSSAGTSAAPDAILQSCLALQQHLQKLEADARKTLKEWEDKRKAEDLAEKRRLAPGWLDSGVHILKPEVDEVKGKEMEVENIMDDDPQQREAEVKKEREGEELDRVFGGMKV